MKMTEKRKRQLAVGGGILICAGLTVVIGLQFAKPPAGEDKLPEPEVMQAAVNPDIAAGETKETNDSREEKELVIQPETGQGAGDAQTEQPIDSRPTQTDEQEQSIQPEVTKSPQPEETDLTNPEEKPDGTKVEGTPEPVDHDTYVPPTDTGSGGNGGLPGFSSVPNGGANAGTQAGDMYENGNKIGSMD